MTKSNDAKVAVITRTRNRPILLPRVLESLRKQTHKDLVWVVVNDGGDPGPVDELIAKAEAKNIRTKVIHNSKSLGMETASNQGISGEKSEFIAIHDDDDTWEPSFLERTTEFLGSSDKYGGVITHATKVEEILTETECTIIRRIPFNPWIVAVYLSDIAHTNSFPPISFLFRRSIYEITEGFDPTLAVLGDWDFNLRFLQLADVGVIPEPLANYHHRVQLGETQAVYGNTVTHGVAQHADYDAILRNHLLRRDLQQGKVGLGLLVSMGRYYGALNNSLSGVNAMMEILRSFSQHSKIGRLLLRIIGGKKYTFPDAPTFKIDS